MSAGQPPITGTEIARERPAQGKSVPLNDILPWAIPAAVLAAWLAYVFNQKLASRKASGDLLVEGIKEFRSLLEDAHDQIVDHQRGKPVEGLKTLSKSREAIAPRLRKIARCVEQLKCELPATIGQELDRRYRDWKVSFMGDVGLIVAKDAADPYLPARFTDEHNKFCSWLKALMHSACRHQIAAPRGN